MHAGVILSELIGMQRWIEPLDTLRVGVTGATELGNILALDVATKSRAGTFGVGCILGIASMACFAAHALVPVNAACGIIDRFFQASLQRCMTLDAHICRLRGGAHADRARHQKNKNAHYPSNTHADNLHLLRFSSPCTRLWS